MSMPHTLILKVRTQNFHSKIEKQLSKEETQTSSQISNEANDDPFLNYNTFKNQVDELTDKTFVKRKEKKKFKNLENFIDFDDNEKKDIKNIINIIDNSEEYVTKNNKSKEINDPDKTVSYDETVQKDYANCIPIEVIM